MTDLSSIIERLKGAKVADRAIDSDIAEALGLVPAAFPIRSTWMAPDLTSSLDAVVALIEEKLPGHGYSVEFVPGNDPPCDGRVYSDVDATAWVGDADDVVRALLIAALSAMKERADAR